MQTKEYRTLDKSGWGEGPWLQEPDKVQFPDPDTGLPCVITRHSFFGNLCGYVGVPEGHPFHGKQYGEVGHLHAHGSVNYSDLCQPNDSESEGVCHVPDSGDPDHVWWFGFDCAHGYDLKPAYAMRNGTVLGYGIHSFEGTYRTLEYVKQQCANLARQLKETEA
jgi:hypothetical protein